MLSLMPVALSLVPTQPLVTSRAYSVRSQSIQLLDREDSRDVQLSRRAIGLSAFALASTIAVPGAFARCDVFPECSETEAEFDKEFGAPEWSKRGQEAAKKEYKERLEAEAAAKAAAEKAEAEKEAAEAAAAAEKAAAEAAAAEKAAAEKAAAAAAKP